MSEGMETAREEFGEQIRAPWPARTPASKIHSAAECVQILDGQLIRLLMQRFLHIMLQYIHVEHT